MKRKSEAAYIEGTGERSIGKRRERGHPVRICGGMTPGSADILSAFAVGCSRPLGQCGDRRSLQRIRDVLREEGFYRFQYESDTWKTEPYEEGIDPFVFTETITEEGGIGSLYDSDKITCSMLKHGQLTLPEPIRPPGLAVPPKDQLQILDKEDLWRQLLKVPRKKAGTPDAYGTSPVSADQP